MAKVELGRRFRRVPRQVSHEACRRERPSRSRSPLLCPFPSTRAACRGSPVAQSPESPARYRSRARSQPNLRQLPRLGTARDGMLPVGGSHDRPEYEVDREAQLETSEEQSGYRFGDLSRVLLVYHTSAGPVFVDNAGGRHAWAEMRRYGQFVQRTSGCTEAGRTAPLLRTRDPLGQVATYGLLVPAKAWHPPDAKRPREGESLVVGQFE